MAYSLGAMSVQMGYMASQMYEIKTWGNMMAVAFETADVERKALVENGPWTAKTDSLARYMSIDMYW